MVSTAMEMIENNWATPEEIDLAVKTSLGIRLPILGVMQSLDFNGLRIINEIVKSQGRTIPMIEEKVKQGHLGPSTSRGIYDYQGRTEAEILQKRDELFFKLLDHLERTGAFKPV
jgi:3-hydroxybutyryl-CoA dehydrogenase